VHFKVPAFMVSVEVPLMTIYVTFFWYIVNLFEMQVVWRRAEDNTLHPVITWPTVVVMG
jgi:hypothetical protein